MKRLGLTILAVILTTSGCNSTPTSLISERVRTACPTYTDTALEIVRVVHGSRDIPRALR